MNGIILGAAVVVTVIALHEGISQKKIEKNQDLGTNVVSIFPGRDVFDDSIESIHTLVPADAEALAKQDFVDSISPEVNTSDTIRFLDKSVTARINGVGRDHFRINGIEFLEGATFRQDRNTPLEVIIDDNARKAFFNGTGIEVIGQVIFLGSVPAKVIGIAKINNHDLNRINVWMPYSTVMYCMTGKPVLSSISVRIKDNIDNEAAINSIYHLLIMRHGVKDFQLYNFERIKKLSNSPQ
ncbi:ABC transporter permease [Pantoea stewartii]|uniref:ABC transporter permease n=1 Tax=Pantoea stewartii TaxID=66269 RepID=UPI0023F98933|nr:ABC transporter permease [Pantoea stewartii]MDF7788616.1 ABC transporter permease [Pantoea stewartii]